MSAAPKKKYESQRQIQRQRNILATARSLLEEEGYAGMTMRGLAKAAGVAQGTLYNLYSSKDDLILAAVDDLLTEIGERAVRQSQSQGIDAILMLGQVTSEQTQQAPKYADAMTRALFRARRDDPIVEILFARAFPFLKAQLNNAQAAGQILASADTDALARQLVGQSWGIILLWLMGLVPLADVAAERRRSDLTTLLSVAIDSTRTRLEAELKQL